MRILKINDSIVDIDDATSIGIDFQAYDVSDPSNRKASVSNNFSIPATIKNLAKLGYANDPQTKSTTIYDSVTCDYWVDSVCLIDKGQLKVTEIGERINCSIVEKDSFWEDLKLYKWSDFLIEWLAWINTNFLTTSHFTSYGSMINSLSSSTEHAHFSYYFGNLTRKEVSAAFIEDSNSLYLIYENSIGGHFSIFIKSIFQFIEVKYGVNFNTSSTEAGNIFNDTVAKKMHIPARRLSFDKAGVSSYFLIVDAICEFSPETDTQDKSDKSIYDLFKGFFQHFNCIIDRRGINDYFISRFDDISNADVIDWSSRITGKPVFYPIIEGYNQQNYITFSSVQEGISKLKNSKYIPCLNKNIDAGSSESSLTTIDAYVAGSFVVGQRYILDLSTPQSFETFEYLIDDGELSTTVRYYISEIDNFYYTHTLPVAALYSLESEYQTLAKMMERPVKWVIKRWLTLNEVSNLRYFKRYWIEQLNGYFFINKISGYNPDKSTEATTIELIKLPNG